MHCPFPLCEAWIQHCSGHALSHLTTSATACSTLSREPFAYRICVAQAHVALQTRKEELPQGVKAVDPTEDCWTRRQPTLPAPQLPLRGRGIESPHWIQMPKHPIPRGLSHRHAPQPRLCQSAQRFLVHQSPEAVRRPSCVPKRSREQAQGREGMPAREDGSQIEGAAAPQRSRRCSRARCRSAAEHLRGARRLPEMPCLPRRCQQVLVG